MKKFILAILFLTGAAFAQCNNTQAVQIGGCPGLPTPDHLVVTISPPTIPIGGTATLSSQIVMSDGSLNTFDTPFCIWSSRTTAAATVPAPNVYPANVVTGVSATSSLITCTDGALSGSATVTVTSPPAITQPNAATCGTPPCSLTQGFIGTVYAYLLQAQGTPPYTWAISVGSLPTGLSLSSVGCGSNVNCNIQGTPSGSPGTTNFTIQVTDASFQIKTLTVSLNIAASGCTPGPPLYPCTPSNVTTSNAPLGSLTSPAGIGVPFNGLTSNGQSTGVGGTGADGTVVADPEPVVNGNSSGLYHNTLTRVTNYWSDCGILNFPTCTTAAANSNWHTFPVDYGTSSDVQHWNTDDTSFYITENTSAMNIFYTWTPGNAGTLAAIFGAGPNTSPLLQMGTFTGTPTWSRVNNHTVYSVQNGSVPNLQSWQTNVTYPTLPTPTVITGLASFNGCLTGLSAVGVSDPLNVSTGDTWISDVWSTATGQNTGRFAVSYNQSTNKCYMWNASNSNYTVCTVGITGSCTTNPIVCQNCGSGVTNPGTTTFHNIKQSPDGHWMIIGPGNCDPSPNVCQAHGGVWFFEPTTGKLWTSCPTTGCTNPGGHTTEGTLNFINDTNQLQYAERLYTNVISSTKFPTTVGCQNQGVQDSHPGWNNTNSIDDAPFFTSFTTDNSTNPNYSFCMVNEAVLYFPPSSVTGVPGTIKREAHTYISANSCAGIYFSSTSISQTGKYALISSNMGGALGCMNGNATGCTQSFTSGCTGNANRGDTFILTLE